MKKKVMLILQGRQHYAQQEPEVVELTTQGTMELTKEGWEISYEESDLTGLMGVTTTFCVQPGTVTLSRRGKLSSEMVFRQGQTHESLYQMEFGALMIAVTARQVFFDLTPEGGCIDLVYDIVIENTEAGVVDYHLDIRTIE